MSPEPSAQRSGWCLGSRSLRNMRKKLGVSVFLLRGQSPKLPPPAGIWGTEEGGAGLPSRVRSQMGRQGQLAGVVRDPRHQVHKSPNPAFCGPKAEKPLGWETRDAGSNPGGPSGTCGVASNDPHPDAKVLDRVTVWTPSRELPGLHF